MSGEDRCPVAIAQVDAGLERLGLRIRRGWQHRSPAQERHLLAPLRAQHLGWESSTHVRVGADCSRDLERQLLDRDDVGVRLLQPGNHRSRGSLVALEVPGGDMELRGGRRPWRQRDEQGPVADEDECEEHAGCSSALRPAEPERQEGQRGEQKVRLEDARERERPNRRRRDVQRQHNDQRNEKCCREPAWAAAPGPGSPQLRVRSTKRPIRTRASSRRS